MLAIFEVVESPIGMSTEPIHNNMTHSPICIAAKKKLKIDTKINIYDLATCITSINIGLLAHPSLSYTENSILALIKYHDPSHSHD